MWGPDAHEFRPERWLEGNLPEGVLELPSLASPTFLAGPRACIGFRFTLIEYINWLSQRGAMILTALVFRRMKAILFSLVRTMKIGLAVPADDIEPKT